MRIICGSLIAESHPLLGVLLNAAEEREQRIYSKKAILLHSGNNDRSVEAEEEFVALRKAVDRLIGQNEDQGDSVRVADSERYSAAVRTSKVPIATSGITRTANVHTDAKATLARRASCARNGDLGARLLQVGNRSTATALHLFSSTQEQIS